MKMVGRVMFLVIAVGMLQGCAYDPYTGTYVPCCAYPAYAPYPAYGYYGPPVVVGGGWYR